MLTVLYSSRLLKSLFGISKVASDWQDKYVWHTTGTGKRTKIQIKNLPTDEKEKYRPIDVKQKRDFDMDIPEIQSAIGEYQDNQSSKAFHKLYSNFAPMIYNSVKKVIGDRPATRDDIEDLKQEAGIIFAKSLKNADRNNQGIISYIQTTMRNQLIAKARDIFSTQLSMQEKDSKLLRAIYKYFKLHSGEQIDYEDMSKEINSKPEYKVTHATPDLIADLISSGTISLDEAASKDDDNRSRHDVIGHDDISKDVSFDESQDEKRDRLSKNKVILRSIDSIDDPFQQKILKLKFGLTEEYGDEQMDPKQIADILGVSRSDVRRKLERAISSLRRMDEIKKLSKSDMLIIKSFNRNVRIAYKPKSIKKISSSSVIIDDKFTINKFSNQFVCSCGINCLHKDIARKYL